jgi:hypothetical protein
MCFVKLHVFVYGDSLSDDVSVALGARISDEWWTGKDLEGSGLGLIAVLSRHLPGGTGYPCKTSARIAPGRNSIQVPLVPAGLLLRWTARNSIHTDNIIHNAYLLVIDWSRVYASVKRDVMWNSFKRIHFCRNELKWVTFPSPGSHPIHTLQYRQNGRMFLDTNTCNHILQYYLTLIMLCFKVKRGICGWWPSIVNVKHLFGRVTLPTFSTIFLNSGMNKDLMS